MKSIRDFLELIKFEHTIFALPFAYLGMLLAAGGWPTFSQFFWITVAMAAARTVAMGFNRIVDRGIDAHNPRTYNRPLVTGSISLRTAWTGTLLAALLLALAAWMLGPLPFLLLPGAFFFLFVYSYTKRFTWLSHFILGFTDGLAPMGAWAAIRGSLFTPEDLPAWILLAVVTLWIGGFDLIYACQDVDFRPAVPAAIHPGPVWGDRSAGAFYGQPPGHAGLLAWLGVIMGLGLAFLDWLRCRWRAAGLGAPPGASR